MDPGASSNYKRTGHHLRRGEPLQARLWADVALKFDSKSPAALYNARLAEERAARLPPAQGVTGTYWCRWGASLGHEVEVQELPGARIRFELQATRIMGSACDHLDFTYRLRFSFGPDELTVTQDGSAQDCGFGGGVHADGTYRRTSRRPPRFTRAVARGPARLPPSRARVPAAGPADCASLRTTDGRPTPVEGDVAAVQHCLAQPAARPLNPGFHPGE